jgi:hypothetical protein
MTIDTLIAVEVCPVCERAVRECKFISTICKAKFHESVKESAKARSVWLRNYHAESCPTCGLSLEDCRKRKISRIKNRIAHLARKSSREDGLDPGDPYIKDGQMTEYLKDEKCSRKPLRNEYGEPGYPVLPKWYTE